MNKPLLSLRRLRLRPLSLRLLPFCALCTVLATPAASQTPPQGRGSGRGVQGPGGPSLPPPDVNAAMTAGEISTGLDAYLTKLSAAGDFAGVVLVAKDGKAIFMKGYGLADRDKREPITDGTRFNIASINKSFTRAAIAQLVSQGKLALTDTIGMRLPDYPNPDARPATIEQLLNHTGGIVDIFDPRFEKFARAQLASNADHFKLIAGEPLYFAPGSENRYCNGCYIVLGEIIAKVSGVPYERYIQQHVFAPVGIAGGFLSYGDPQVAMGYTKEGDALVPAASKHGRRGSAAGGAFMTAADLLAFDNGVRDGRILDAKAAAWFLRVDAVEPGTRAPGRAAIAGGAEGANAVLDGGPTWTVVVLSNLDPPTASRLAPAIARALNQ